MQASPDVPDAEPVPFRTPCLEHDMNSGRTPSSVSPSRTRGPRMTSRTTSAHPRPSRLSLAAIVAALALPVLALLATPLTAMAAKATDARAQALAPYFGGMAIEAITVTATDSVFEDRVVVRWPSAPNANVFWRVKRNGVLLSVLSSQDSSYADTSGVAGQVYTYSVTLYNAATQAQIDIGSAPGSPIGLAAA